MIVGGGTSGLVVANRLSEDPDLQILVVEAGADHTNDPRVKIPALYNALKATEADWKFTTETQVSLPYQESLLMQTHPFG